MSLIIKYFPGLSAQQIQSYESLEKNLKDWNQKINLISRKDIDQFELRHLLHSMALAKFLSFKPGTRILDVGTGGGLPGLPLAIYFPDCHFTLVDSIGKKIHVVNELIKATRIENVKARQIRAETLTERFDFVVSRAVTAFPRFYELTNKLLKKKSFNDIKNGIIYLKGGDLREEIKGFQDRIQLHPLSNWYDEEWFNEKYILYLPEKSQKKIV